MTDELTCAAARRLAPDLALGLLPGAERARLLAHLAGCPSCDALVAELADVADSLLLLAPGADPPPGFESAVLARIDAEPASRPAEPDGREPAARAGLAESEDHPSAHRADGGLAEPEGRASARPARRPRRIVLVALAAVVVVLGGTVAGVALTDRGPEYPPVAVGAGRSLRSAALVGPHGEQWGEVFLFDGKTSWVMVTMRWGVPDGTYNVVVERRTGSPEWLTKLHLAGGEGSIGTTLVDAPEVTAVRVLNTEGQAICEARFA